MGNSKIISAFIVAIIGSISGIVAYVLAVVFFGWKLALILFLLEFSGNIFSGIKKEIK